MFSNKNAVKHSAPHSNTYLPPLTLFYCTHFLVPKQLASLAPERQSLHLPTSRPELVQHTLVQPHCEAQEFVFKMLKIDCVL